MLQAIELRYYLDNNQIELLNFDSMPFIDILMRAPILEARVANNLLAITHNVHERFSDKHCSESVLFTAKK